MKPTIGRIVWYHPTPGITHAAQIAAVHSDICVNLGVLNEFGEQYAVRSVPLAREDDEKPTVGNWCEWMPYQVGQAKVHAAEIPAPASEVSIESEILSKALTAPRVTHARIDEVVVSEDFYVFPGTTLTVCCLTLKNGFTVVGESACASVANFDAELGQRIARENAKEKIWALEGYALRNVLAQGLCY